MSKTNKKKRRKDKQNTITDDSKLNIDPHKRF